MNLPNRVQEILKKELRSEKEPDRSLQRVSRCVQRLQKIWARHPELRLGQMILNAVETDSLYYMEDEDLIKRLEEKSREYTLREKKGEKEE